MEFIDQRCCLPRCMSPGLAHCNYGLSGDSIRAHECFILGVNSVVGNERYSKIAYKFRIFFIHKQFAGAPEQRKQKEDRLPNRRDVPRGPRTPSQRRVFPEEESSC